jgi:xanthine dehydrogenase accessory factor
MGSVGQSGDLTLAGWPGLIAAPGGNRLFVDPVAPDAVLYLFGGGHVATFVAPLAAQVGFRVAVIDDRAEFVSPERFPDVDQRHRLDFDTALERLPVTSRTYIAIMTRGHASDLTVVRGAVRTEAAYIGMMASSRKQRMIRDTLRREGVDDVRLDDVHTPIGVPIEAETPAEIAVSIVGELIRVRARRRSEGKA